MYFHFPTSLLGNSYFAQGHLWIFLCQQNGYLIKIMPMILRSQSESVGYESPSEQTPIKNTHRILMLNRDQESMHSCVVAALNPLAGCQNNGIVVSHGMRKITAVEKKGRNISCKAAPNVAVWLEKQINDSRLQSTNSPTQDRNKFSLQPLCQVKQYSHL